MHGQFIAISLPNFQLFQMITLTTYICISQLFNPNIWDSVSSVSTNTMLKIWVTVFQYLPMFDHWMLENAYAP